jgi:hypothetical protein
MWQLFRSSTPAFEEYPRLPIFPSFTADDYTNSTPIAASSSESRLVSAPATVKLSGASVLNNWIIIKKAQVNKAARVPVPTNVDAFDLTALDGHEAGVALIESLRSVLSDSSTPPFLHCFSGRLPKDVADYLHVSATYTMYVPSLL